MVNAKNLIEFYEENYIMQGSDSYAATIAYAKLEHAIHDFINAVIALMYKEKGIEEFKNFTFDNIDAIKISGENGVFKLAIGTDVNCEFVEEFRHDVAYLGIYGVTDYCIVDTNLYEVKSEVIKSPDWLVDMISSFYDNYDLYESHVVYIGPRIRQENKRKNILKEKGEAALKEYDALNEKISYSEKIRERIIRIFREPNLEYWECETEEEAREFISKLYPEEYQEWKTRATTPPCLDLSNAIIDDDPFSW